MFMGFSCAQREVAEIEIARSLAVRLTIVSAKEERSAQAKMAEAIHVSRN
jgi:hypothetical protein